MMDQKTREWLDEQMEPVRNRPTKAELAELLRILRFFYQQGEVSSIEKVAGSLMRYASAEIKDKFEDVRNRFFSRDPYTMVKFTLSLDGSKPKEYTPESAFRLYMNGKYFYLNRRDELKRIEASDNVEGCMYTLLLMAAANKIKAVFLLEHILLDWGIFENKPES